MVVLPWACTGDWFLGPALSCDSPKMQQPAPLSALHSRLAAQAAFRKPCSSILKNNCGKSFSTQLISSTSEVSRVTVIKKSCFLLHAISGRADKLKDLISFQNCHLATHRIAVNSGNKIMGGVSSRQQNPTALGISACST